MSGWAGVLLPRNVEVRRQFLRFGSLLLLWVLGTELWSFWPDGKHLYLLSHLTAIFPISVKKFSYYHPHTIWLFCIATTGRPTVT